MRRYHPVIVALHWLLALMILMSLLIFGPILHGLAHEGRSEYIDGLSGHMVFGLMIGLLTALRLVVRVFSTVPPPPETGGPMIQFAGRLMHWTLYLCVLLMVGLGVATAVDSGLFAIVFRGSDAPLPDVHQITFLKMHRFVGQLLLGLIFLHVLASLYHQFFLRDGLLSRMWFAARD